MRSEGTIRDYSNARPDKAIRAYRVEMHINAGLRDLPIRVSVSSSGKELRPWQAYASYFLTGGWVLYGNCGKGLSSIAYTEVGGGSVTP